VAEDGKGAMRRNRCVLGPPNWKASDCAHAPSLCVRWWVGLGGGGRQAGRQLASCNLSRAPRLLSRLGARLAAGKCGVGQVSAPNAGAYSGLLPLGSSAPNHPLADLWTQSTRAEDRGAAGGQWSGRAWYVAAHRGADATSRPIRARYVGGERLRWPPFFFKPEIRAPLTEAEAPHEAGAAVSLIGRAHLRICHRARTSEI
jgi:hypothetical protein